MCEERRKRCAEASPTAASLACHTRSSSRMSLAAPPPTHPARRVSRVTTFPTASLRLDSSSLLLGEEEEEEEDVEGAPPTSPPLLLRFWLKTLQCASTSKEMQAVALSHTSLAAPSPSLLSTRAYTVPRIDSRAACVRLSPAKAPSWAALREARAEVRAEGVTEGLVEVEEEWGECKDRWVEFPPTTLPPP